MSISVRLSCALALSALVPAFGAPSAPATPAPAAASQPASAACPGPSRDVRRPTSKLRHAVVEGDPCPGSFGPGAPLRRLAPPQGAPASDAAARP